MIDNNDHVLLRGRHCLYVNRPTRQTVAAGVTDDYSKESVLAAGLNSTCVDSSGLGGRRAVARGCS